MRMAKLPLETRRALRTAQCCVDTMRRRHAASLLGTTIGYILCDVLPDVWAAYVKAVRRGWYAAADVFLRRFMYRLEQAVEDLGARDAVDLGKRWRSAAASRPIVEEFRALAADAVFAGVDTASGEVMVTTHDIVLDGVNFGPFQVVLPDLASLPCLHVTVIPRAPFTNPSASNVSHPHVLDNRLCLGRGEAAVRAAICEGRLHDYFLIVWRLLLTYQPASAYMPLEAWRSGEASREVLSWQGRC